MTYKERFEAINKAHEENFTSFKETIANQESEYSFIKEIPYPYNYAISFDIGGNKFLLVANISRYKDQGVCCLYQTYKLIRNVSDFGKLSEEYLEGFDILLNYETRDYKSRFLVPKIFKIADSGTNKEQTLLTNFGENYFEQLLKIV